MRELLLFFTLSAASDAPAPATRPLDLDDVERGFIVAHPTIRVALANQGPFAFADSDGTPVGLSVDYLALFAQRTGLRLQPLVTATVLDALDGVRRGEVDAVMGIGKTEEREELLRFGVPYSYSPDAIVTRVDSPFVFDLRELAGKRVAIARSSKAIAEELRSNVNGVELAEYDSMREAVLSVSRGDAMAAVVDASIAAFTIKQLHLTSLRVAGVFSAPADVYIGVRKDWAPLVSILDKAIRSIPASDRIQLNDRWMALDYASDRRWQRAFLYIAGVLAAVTVMIGMLVIFARRTRRELELRRKVQAELEVAHDRIEKINDEKSELLRMVAHDLRNPLTSLRLNTQMLSLDGPDPGLLADMKSSLDEMHALIALLVDRQAIEAGRRALSWTTIDAAEEARATVQALAEVARRKQIRIDVDCAEGLPSLTADRGGVHQVIDNLVSNALKYSPSGTTVRVEVSLRKNCVRISVLDQGPGVPASERATIFEKYRVGSARPTGGETSTGLGLWIVARIVANMNGRVGCDDAPGGGACFWFELPL